MAAAPSVWLVWGLPGALVLLFVLVVVSRMESGPLQWVSRGAGNGAVAVENPVLTPVRGEKEDTDQADTGPADLGQPPSAEGARVAVADASFSLAPDSPTETSTPTPQPTDTAESTATPTASPLPTETATQSATLTASPSPTAAGRAYSVQEGDTAFSIANRFQISVADLLKVNQLAPSQALQLKPGTSLGIPGTGPLEVTGLTATPSPNPTQTNTSQPIATSTATLTGTPTKTPTALAQATAPGQRLYTIVSGDTPVAIALRFSVSAEALLAANGLSLEQARNLQVGQQLIIPGPQQAPTPTATPPRPTAIPTATSTPTVTIRLDAPTQVDPVEDINIQCNAEQTIKWNPVEGLWPGDEYVFFLGYVDSAPDADGNVVVVPLLEQHTKTRTNLVLNLKYCNLASQSFGRRWRWYVQIFNGDTPVSPPSETWEFTWR